LFSINKEQGAYEKEAETQQKRIDKLIADGADEADVRKQVTLYKTWTVTFSTGRVLFCSLVLIIT
jgi:hypothetical protein